MTKSNLKKQNDSAIDVFSFGEPETCLSNHYTEYVGVYADSNGVYAPPISLHGLMKLLRVNAQHAPILYFKRNMMMKWLRANTALSYRTAKKFAFDYCWSANGYLQTIRNPFGQIIKLKHLPSITMRYTTTPGVYAQIRNNGAIQRFKTWRSNSYQRI